MGDEDDFTPADIPDLIEWRDYSNIWHLRGGQWRRGLYFDGQTHIGVDLAQPGADMSVEIEREGDRITSIKTIDPEKTDA